MFRINPNPIVFQFGNFQLSHYVLFYFLGLILILFSLFSAIKKNKIRASKEQACELSIYTIFSILIFARLFHVLFWGLDYFSQDWIKVFYIWEGGVSFHGALLGAILSIYFYTKIKKINFLKLLDILIIPATFVLVFGRIGNFINAEILGKATNIFWCVKFFNEVCRHPVQIYSAFFFLVIFLILIFVKSKIKNLKEGILFFMFIFLAAIARIITDFFVEDKVYFYLTTGQWMSIVTILVGVCFIQLIKSPRNL